MNAELLPLLTKKAKWVWQQTLAIHKIAPEVRIASSLSPIEILVALFYGQILHYHPQDQYAPDRDRLIISKGHGSISLYPILADCGFFPLSELSRVCQPGCFLGAIPDPIIPGYETINGSLGHGLGVASGIALALNAQGIARKVYVLLGDGELYEGAIWEAIMFCGHHKLHNLTAIIDNNATAMLGFTKDIIDHRSLGDKFECFGWTAHNVDGHDVAALYHLLSQLKAQPGNRPNVIIANTIKGHGVAKLEHQPLSHILSLNASEIDEALRHD